MGLQRGLYPRSGFVEEGKTQPGHRREIKQSPPGTHPARHWLTGPLLSVCSISSKQPLAEAVFCFFIHFAICYGAWWGLGATGAKPRRACATSSCSVKVWVGVQGSGALALSLVQRQEVRLTLESPWAVELPLPALQVRGHIFDTQGLGRR